MIKAYPVIGISVDIKLLDNAPFHIVGEKYINAIVLGADCYLVILPAIHDTALDQK